MFNVNHFIVSQVNPHVIPFLAKEDEFNALEAQSDSTSGPGWIHTLMGLAKVEAMHRMHVLAELGVFPNALSKARSVLNQKYSGDITIFPEISYTDFPRMLKNPTTEFILHAMLCGERATWPKLSRVRNHCAIELALDDAVQQLRARVVFSPSQVDLRLNVFTRATGDDAGSMKESEAATGRGRKSRRGSLRASEPVGQPPTQSLFKLRPTTVQPNRSNTHASSMSKSPSISPNLPSRPHSSPSTSPSSSSLNTRPSSPEPRTDVHGLNSSSPSSPSSPSYFSHHINGSKQLKSRYLFPHASQPCTPAVGGIGGGGTAGKASGFSHQKRHWQISSPSVVDDESDDDDDQVNNKTPSSSSPSSSLSAVSLPLSSTAGDKLVQAGLIMTPSSRAARAAKPLTPDTSKRKRLFDTRLQNGLSRAKGLDSQAWR